MPNPIGAKETKEVDIGLRVHDIARRGEQADDATNMNEWIERQPAGLPTPEVDIKLGEPEDKKWVVIPNLEAIENGLAVVKTSNDGYPLRLEYSKQSFEDTIAALLEAVEKHPNVGERPIISAFLEGLAPPDRLDKEDFFYFRLGEYCVNQCF